MVQIYRIQNHYALLLRYRILLLLWGNMIVSSQTKQIKLNIEPKSYIYILGDLHTVTSIHLCRQIAYLGHGLFVARKSLIHINFTETSLAVGKTDSDIIKKHLETRKGTMVKQCKTLLALVSEECILADPINTNSKTLHLSLGFGASK